MSRRRSSHDDGLLGLEARDLAREPVDVVGVVPDRGAERDLVRAGVPQLVGPAVACAVIREGGKSRHGCDSVVGEPRIVLASVV